MAEVLKVIQRDLPVRNPSKSDDYLLIVLAFDKKCGTTLEPH